MHCSWTIDVGSYAKVLHRILDDGWMLIGILIYCICYLHVFANIYRKFSIKIVSLPTLSPKQRTFTCRIILVAAKRQVIRSFSVLNTIVFFFFLLLRYRVVMLIKKKSIIERKNWKPCGNGSVYMDIVIAFSHKTHASPANQRELEQNCTRIRFLLYRKAWRAPFSHQHTEVSTDYDHSLACE